MVHCKAQVNKEKNHSNNIIYFFVFVYLMLISSNLVFELVFFDYFCEEIVNVHQNGQTPTGHEITCTASSLKLDGGGNGIVCST